MSVFAHFCVARHSFSEGTPRSSRLELHDNSPRRRRNYFWDRFYLLDAKPVSRIKATSTLLPSPAAVKAT